MGFEHPSHPTHPLVICNKAECSGAKCNGCGSACDDAHSGMIYGCDSCKFFLDKSCLDLPTVDIYHLSHPSHPLVICNKAECSSTKCNGCGSACDDAHSGVIYGCDSCKFFLDKSCLDLPTVDIYHPDHPDGHLTLHTSTSDFCCSSCSLPHTGFCYRCCSHCDFCLDVRCAVPSLIKLNFHAHRLSYFKEWRGSSISCYFCKRPCESHVLYCLECQFAFHLLCGSLPSSIHFEYCHREHLILTPSFEADEDGSDDEDSDAYCYECWEDIELHSPAYICRQCDIFVHVTCVVDQVLSSLKEERVGLKRISAKAVEDEDDQGPEEVEIGEDDPGAEEVKIETLRDILNSFNDSEKKHLNRIRKMRVAETVRVLAVPNNTQPTRSSPFLDEAFARFIERLNNLDVQDASPLELNEDSEEVVAVGEYKVSRKLAPVLEDLFAKHGDVSAKADLSSKVKTYFFVILCWTIYSMLNTKVGEISEGLLHRWWSCLILVYSSGFTTNFAIDRLKVVMRAYYSLQDKDKSNTTKLDKDIVDLSDEIVDLERKLEEKKRRLSSRKESRDKMGGPSPDENLMEAYSSKALAWKW